MNMKLKCFTTMIRMLFLLIFTSGLSAAPTSLESAVSHHMQLARLLNSIVFRNDATSESMTPSKVLAGFWNVADPEVLANLTSIGNTTLFADLGTLIDTLEKIPEGLDVIANVTDIRQKVSELTSMSQTDLTALKNALNFQSFPKVMTDTWDLTFFGTDHMTIAFNALEKFRLSVYNPLGSESEKTDLSDIETKLKTCEKYFDHPIFDELKTFVNLPQKEKHLKVMMDAVDVVKPAGKFAGALVLQRALDSAEMSLKSLKKLGEIVPNTSQNLTGLAILLNEAMDKLSVPIRDTPLGAALASRDGSFPEELELSDWLRKLFTFDVKQNSGEKMKALSLSYSDLKNLFNSISTMKATKYKKLQRIIPKLEAILSTAIRFVPLEIAANESISVRDSLALVTTTPSDISKATGLSNDLKTIDAAINNVLKKIDQMKQTGFSSLSTAITMIAKHKGTKGACKKNAGECAVAISNARTAVSALQGPAGAIASQLDANNLILISGMPARKNEFPNTNKWMRDILELIEQDIQKLNVTVFEELNDVSAKVQATKRDNFLPEFKNKTEQWINSTREGLSTLEKKLEPIRNKQPKNISEFIKHRDILWEVVGGVSALDRLLVLAAKLEKVIEGGKAIASDAAIKSATGGVWDGFAAQVQGILEIEIMVKVKALKGFNVSISANFSDMIPVYQKAAEMNISLPPLNLRPFIESLESLPSPSPDIIEYLELLNDVDQSLATTNWNLEYASFQKTPDALLDVDAIFYNYLRGVSTSHFTTVLEYQRPRWIERQKTVSMVFLIIAILGVWVSGALALWKKFGKKRKRKIKTKGNKPEEVLVPFAPYQCTAENYKYSFVQMQDARLRINKFDKFHRTPLFRALEQNDYEEAKRLLEEGALVDKVCGFQLVSPLYLAVINWNPKMVELLLKHGAWIYQPDVFGKNPNSFADSFDCRHLFDEYNYKQPCRRTIPPKQRRYFHVLVVNAKKYTKQTRAKLSRYIKITWGYRRRMKLNQFSHIVLPNKHVAADGKTLLLSNTNPFIWKCVAALGSLMSEKWIEELLSNPDALHNDIPHMLLHTQLNSVTHIEVLLKLKSDPHRGRPKFLKNVCIHFLTTSNAKEMARQKEWAEAFAMFSAQIVKKPVACTEKTLEPYSAQYMQYFLFNDWQSSMWIIKYPDSQIDPVWRADWTKFTLIPIDFVLECIASYRILPVNNKIVPLDTQRPLPTPGSFPGIEKVRARNEKEMNRNQMEELSKQFEANPTASWRKLKAECAKVKEQKDQKEKQRVAEVQKKLEEDLERWRTNIQAPMSETSTIDASRASRKVTPEQLDETQEGVPISKSTPKATSKSSNKSSETSGKKKE